MPGAGVLDLRIREKRFASPPSAARRCCATCASAPAPGEVVALLGRSGAGKSTLLRIALGLDRDFDGGRDAFRAGRIGVVFQEPLSAALADGGREPAPCRDRRRAGARHRGAARRGGAGGCGGAAARRAFARHGAPRVGGARACGRSRRAGAGRAVRLARPQLAGGTGRAADDRGRAGRARWCWSPCTTSSMRSPLPTVSWCCMASRPVLAADVAVPDRGDAAALEGLRGELLARFAFLAADGHRMTAGDGGTVPLRRVLQVACLLAGGFWCRRRRGGRARSSSTT